MRQFGKTLIVGAIALAAACSATAPAWAGYMWGGDGMGVVASGTIPNGAVSLQSVGPGRNTPPFPAGIRRSSRPRPVTMLSLPGWCWDSMADRQATWPP